MQLQWTKNQQRMRWTFLIKLITKTIFIHLWTPHKLIHDQNIQREDLSLKSTNQKNQKEEVLPRIFTLPICEEQQLQILMEILLLTFLKLCKLIILWTKAIFENTPQ